MNRALAPSAEEYPGASQTDDASDPVRDAEAAVAALADSFLEWITEDIDRARAALKAAEQKPGDNADQINAVFEVMHNVKGQGSSFGYNLLTMIGGSLCDYIRELAGTADEKQVKVIAAHFAAIDFVLQKSLQGDGGEVGVQLESKLNQLIANVPATA